MKKEQRIPYLILAEFQGEIPVEMCTSLCAFCRYCSWEGGGNCCDNTPVCEHPIEKLADDENQNANAYEGSDCWGFRPAYSREDCVDIVGLYLQGKYVNWNTVQTIGRKKEAKGE